MKRNVGATDRAVRIVIGFVLLAAILFIAGPLRWFGLIGVIPLLTGIVGYCPLYGLFGLDTCPLEKKPAA